MDAPTESLTVSPTADASRVRAADGRVLAPPATWALLPPGDAGLTRRVKAAGPTWTVVEKKGNKTFSRGVWAERSHIEAARAALAAERATPAYAKRLASDAKRREVAQGDYVREFEAEVRAFLRFAPSYEALGRALATAVTAHATPVGSGTVARTKRISVDRRAEAAVIAWMRHQTTAYDSMKIARVKGERRAVRRELAEISRAILDLHRRDVAHAIVSCPLCKSLAR
ncbi:MAG: DUF2293 domain-containing protein [Deltaproteobacteria bacterium]|nr:DUF2293 domain-containing protein [Deltaproteobacteria bacterium]